MRIRGGAALDPGEVIDQRGAGSALPVGCLLGGGGGGILGVIGLVILLVALTGGGGGGGSSQTGDLASRCTTGAAAAQSSDCRVVAIVNSVQDYWASALPARGVRYTKAPTVLYTGATESGCGLASSSTGPFYCPNDKRVYLDLSFFDDLHTQLGAQSGKFAQAYVIAHEYGHHVQDLLGVFDRVGTPTNGATGTSVRLELQADCYAGVWADHAQETKIIENVTRADIHDALNAAAAVGDDRIQREETGHVQPDNFTHGTSVQRDRWFERGYTSGTLTNCDTFSAPSL